MTKVTVEYGSGKHCKKWVYILPLDLTHIVPGDAVTTGLELALDTARAQRDTGTLQIENTPR